MTSAAAHARRGRRERRPVWTWFLPVCMVLAAAGIPLLLYYAGNAILNSSDGELTQRPTDPAAPGYEVLVLPSPSHMVLGLDPDGQLASVVILSLASNDRGGTALFIPAETLVDADRRLIDVHATEGEVGTRSAVAELIDINTTGFNQFDDAGWAGITAPVAPIPVDNPVDLTSTAADGSSAETVFPMGNISVEADQAAAYMGWINPGEAIGARLDRQIAFWKAWTATLAASSDTGAIPGERDSGIGRMLAGLANGPSAFDRIDGEDLTLADGRRATRIDIPALRARVLNMVPFPLPVEPGARPRVRLLDGVGGLDIATTYSGQLVAAGAQIAVIGNATEFGTEETHVVYHDKRFESQALAFGETLGGAAVDFEPVEDAVLDVTVVIGQDIGGAPG